VTAAVQGGFYFQLTDEGLSVGTPVMEEYPQKRRLTWEES
jgi:hypothetical protein